MYNDYTLSHCDQSALCLIRTPSSMSKLILLLQECSGMELSNTTFFLANTIHICFLFHFPLSRNTMIYWMLMRVFSVKSIQNLLYLAVNVNVKDCCHSKSSIWGITPNQTNSAMHWEDVFIIYNSVEHNSNGCCFCCDNFLEDEFCVSVSFKILELLGELHCKAVKY